MRVKLTLKTREIAPIAANGEIVFLGNAPKVFKVEGELPKEGMSVFACLLGRMVVGTHMAVVHQTPADTGLDAMGWWDVVRESDLWSGGIRNLAWDELPEDTRKDITTLWQPFPPK